MFLAFSVVLSLFFVCEKLSSNHRHIELLHSSQIFFFLRNVPCSLVSLAFEISLLLFQLAFRVRCRISCHLDIQISFRDEHKTKIRADTHFEEFQRQCRLYRKIKLSHLHTISEVVITGGIILTVWGGNL